MLFEIRILPVLLCCILFTGVASYSKSSFYFNQRVRLEHSGDQLTAFISPRPKGSDVHSGQKNEALIDMGTINYVTKSNFVKFTVDPGEFCDTYIISSENPNHTLSSCFDLKNYSWFGGPEHREQLWPVEKLVLKDYSYVTKSNDNSGVMEPYWLSSNGSYVFVSKYVPLFVDQNNEIKNFLCLKAKYKNPYLVNTIPLTLNLTVCQLDDPKSAHMDAVKRFLGKPSGLPDRRMMTHPVWSTWAYFKSLISEQRILNFANEIVSYGFNNSQMEIDDRWEDCYGTFLVDKTRFPNMKTLSGFLKSVGFRVVLWVHPFINLDCKEVLEEALKKNYVVKNDKGNPNTTWWNGNAVTIDFTKPEAVRWWTDRLVRLKEENDIDSFKFDAGETSWLPQLPSLNASIDLQPGIHSTEYLSTVALFGNMVEARVGWHSQRLPIFIRMLDKDTKWGLNNGLKSLVTTLLLFNMVGHPLVLPDMVGGNGYGGDSITKELFIRWTQATVFMPCIEFSYVPWIFDDETVEITKNFTSLRYKYADMIYESARKAVEDGTPANPPIWWIDPSDSEAYAIDSEYLLGDSILVAPVMDEHARSRDIYLPKGTWRDELRAKTIAGPTWLRNYTAELNELPYFIYRSK